MADPAGVNAEMRMVAGTIEPRPQRRLEVAREIADLLIVAARLHGPATVWLDPVDGRPGVYRVTVERGRRELAHAVLPAGVGDAVIARLALLCDIDLLARGSQSGRCAVRCGDERYELWVTTRPDEQGLCGELRVLREEEHDSVVVTLEEPPPLPVLLAPGTSVGPYRVVEQLGEGGMGIVYRVEHAMLGKQFAMKVLRHELIQRDPDSVRRFLREARAAARTHDDGIVSVTDYGTLADGRPYLVMELLSGRSLEAVLAAEGALPLARAVALMRRITAALAAAHARGVIHRDLTPSNVFVLPGDEEGERIKLVDFGTARILDADQAEAPDGPPGIVFGTPYYMAPEQARGDETDQRSDLYALGVVLYELVSGTVPFDGESVREIMRQHVYVAAPAVTSPHEIVPEALERMVARLLRKDPAERYQSADELLADLGRIDEILTRRGWRRWLPS